MKSIRSRKETLALVSVSALILILTSAGWKCNSKAGNNNTGLPRDELRKVDGLIETNVRQALSDSPQVDAVNIQIGSESLKVTLKGEVRSEQERNEAVRLARQVEVQHQGKTFKVAEVDASNLKIRSNQ